MTEPKQHRDSIPDVALWVEEYGTYLLRYAMRYLRDRDFARDIVQDTFLAAVVSSSSFEGRSHPKTWLSSILRNKIIDHYRRKSVRQVEHVPDISHETGQRYFEQGGHWTKDAQPRIWPQSPEQFVQQKQLAGAIEECISKLPERFREVFLLRELDGYSRADIADNLETSESNVGVILHRSRLALRKCLETFILETESC